MEVITNKTAFLRKAKNQHICIGVLPSNKECDAMCATIARWNREEGRGQNIRLSYQIDRKDGTVAIVRKRLERKEVAND